ncbi:MAG TPA: DUF1800 domain-containing protein [Gemmataceae bacterium]|nr:DUF1800 domain-containing protein [Gemmataceae bacterium]
MAENPLPLDKVDPSEAWQPWEPDAKQPWNLKWAGHLYRRAAFGAPLDRLREAVSRGLPATLEQLLHGEPDSEERLRFLEATGEKIAGQNNPYQLRGWWLYVMLHSGHPLREKMTLFWHNHFATSIAKVRWPQLMFKQNRLLRRHALGKFEPFLQAISKDPAMLKWLDSNSNVAGKPNENYARELMELFSLGVGNYTETDIREAARAFTGWHTTSEDASAEFAFNPRFHDTGAKTIFGKTGNWNGDDVVRLCLEKPAAARFIARKLYHFFISENAAPPDALLEPLADAFRQSDYDIAVLVRRMLGSRHFFSVYAYRQRIKSPVEFVLGAAHDVLALVGPNPNLRQQILSPESLVGRVDALGQQLFAPPNVKGWIHGRAWLNTTTVLARHNFAQALTAGSGRINLEQPPEQAPAVAPAPDPAAAIRRENLTDPVKIVALLADVLLQGDIPAPARARLVAFLQEGKPEGNALDQRVRETVHAIMTMPEYQLA